MNKQEALEKFKQNNARFHSFFSNDGLFLAGYDAGEAAQAEKCCGNCVLYETVLEETVGGDEIYEKHCKLGCHLATPKHFCSDWRKEGA